MNPEALLVLKQAVEISRGNTEKGMKDRIDIMDMLLKCQIDFAEYRKILEKEKLTNFKDRLIGIVSKFNELKYINLTPRKLKLKKGEIVKNLRK